MGAIKYLHYFITEQYILHVIHNMHVPDIQKTLLGSQCKSLDLTFHFQVVMLRVNIIYGELYHYRCRP